MTMKSDYKAYTKEFDQLVKTEDIPPYPIKGHIPPYKGFSPETRGNYGPLFDEKINKIENDALHALDALTAEHWHCLDETAVSIIVDHSGSLLNPSANHGESAVSARLITETLSHLLFLFGIKHAVTGYTTCNWKGGRSRQKWKTDGSPANPGRLCDLLHITYRDFDADDGQKPVDMVYLFRPDILKENIDGEAIEFAVSLLKPLEQRRKIFIYLADGAPSDDSTLNENRTFFLSDHCAMALEKIQNTDDISLYGFGVSYSLDGWVKHSSYIENSAEAVGTAFNVFKNTIFPFSSL